MTSLAITALESKSRVSWGFQYISGDPDEDPPFGGVSVETWIYCLKQRVKTRSGGTRYIAKLLPPSWEQQVFALGSLAFKSFRLPCDSGRIPVGLGGTTSQSPVALWKLFRRVDLTKMLPAFRRGGAAIVAGNPTGDVVEGSISVGCMKDRQVKVKTTRRTGAPSQADTARRKVKAKPVVKTVTREHTIPPHPGGVGTTQITTKCKKNFTATSYGWDARDDLVANAFLWTSPRLKKRKVTSEVKNLGSQAHTVSLTAVCLAMKFKRL